MRAAATILIADDDPLVRAAYKSALERRGYQVLLADDGNGAVELIEQQTIDLVLLDILMPNKEGLETLIELKRRFPDITIFVMSGGGTRSSHDFLSVASKFGADAVLRKPFSPQSLFDLIDAKIGTVHKSASA
jgi:DNA-binding response OmpR family regulator